MSIVVPDPYWTSLAKEYWRLGPPLMPSDEDAQSMEGAMRTYGNGAHATRALLLGMTPKLADMRWPEGTMLLASDSSMPFVRAVWPGNIPRRRWAVQAIWSSLPVRDGSWDVVAGDGSFNCLRYPEGIRAAASSVKRALRPDGILVLRWYVRPDASETPEQVLCDLAANRIDTFHQFKFRLLIAMQRSVEEGVRVADVYDYWKRLGLNRDSLPPKDGWSPQAVETIEKYRGSSTVHTFPSLREWRAVLADFFIETSLRKASYTLGDWCPVVVLRPRN